MNTPLFIAAIFIATLLIGRLLERIHVPWIFAALIIGTGLAVYNPFTSITSSESFELLGELGMYLLLFLVGFELDTEKLKQKSGFIFRSALFIILLEGLLGSLVVHFVFEYSWFVSLLVSLSFATVGEAILVPILHEFKLVNTDLGQAIIGIGTADDITEILLLLAASILVGHQSEGSIVLILSSLAALIILTLGLRFLRKERAQFKFASIETLFFFILFVFFLFVGIGAFAAAEPLAAILAGVSIRLFVPSERLVFVENELRALTYGLFAPIFFVWIGSTLNIEYLTAFPLLVLLVIVVSNGAKLLGGYLMGRKELGTNGALLLGLGLSVRFSTSIIIIKFLYDNNIIDSEVFSVVVASSIILMFIIPVLFAQLVTRWGVPAR